MANRDAKFGARGLKAHAESSDAIGRAAQIAKIAAREIEDERDTGKSTDALLPVSTHHIDNLLFVLHTASRCRHWR